MVERRKPLRRYRGPIDLSEVSENNRIILLRAGEVVGAMGRALQQGKGAPRSPDSPGPPVVPLLSARGMDKALRGEDPTTAIVCVQYGTDNPGGMPNHNGRLGDMAFPVGCASLRGSRLGITRRGHETEFLNDKQAAAD